MIGLTLDGLAMNFVRPACIIPQNINRALDIHSPSNRKCLSIIQGFKRSELILILLDQVR